MMRTAILISILLLEVFIAAATGGFHVFYRSGTDGNNTDTKAVIPEAALEEPEESTYREIKGVVKSGEAMYDIFKRHDLDTKDLLLMREASVKIHKLKNIYINRPYVLRVDGENRVQEFIYDINDSHSLIITRTDSGFIADRLEIEYEKKIADIGGVIKDNLISSIGEGRENLALALNLSDIFAWDIDFTTDLRKGDTFRIVVEELHQDNEFKRYGAILAAEFANNGSTYTAYRFENEETSDYYDSDGNSLRRAFLKAPLSFRRISSSFSKRRYHPVLKRYRPHHGIDYAADTGTPVSAAGDGSVMFAAYDKSYGNLVIIRHPNGYKTYYGHLSRFGKGIKKGIKVKQGQLIGYVGSTGISTGPHLHYEMRINDRVVNPHKIKISAGRRLPQNAMEKFRMLRDMMTIRLAAINVNPSTVVATKEHTAADTSTADGV